MLRPLFPYLKSYKKQLILGPFFKLIEAVFELCLPMVMAELIDRGVKAGNGDLVVRYGLVILGLAVLGACSAYVCQYYASIASQGFGTRLRSSLFEKMGQFSFAELDSFGTETLVNRLTNDVNQLQQAVAMIIRLVIRAPFLCLGGLVMALIINPLLSLVLFVAVPVLAAALYLIMKKTAPLFGRQQKKLDRLALDVKENLAGSRVIRAFDKQAEQEAEFAEDNAAFYRAAMRIQKISSLLNPATLLIINLAMVAILWFGGVQVNAGSMTQGEVVAYINYATIISSAMIVLSNLVVLFTKAWASAGRVTEILQTRPSVADDPRAIPLPPPSEAPAVRFEQVSFAFSEDGQNVLEGLDFEVGRGQKFGIIGPTGSGKSTLINLLCRFYDVGAGSVSVNGSDVRKVRQASLLKGVGLVPQKISLLSGTVRSNLALGLNDPKDEKLWKALDIAQCGFVREKEGLETEVRQNGANFSGGQKQRLTIARALAKDPEILIFDDSLSALDSLTCANLLRALREAFPDLTLFLVSQRVSTVQDCDQILVLDNGRPAGLGRHEELLNSCALYREIYQSQVQS